MGNEPRRFRDNEVGDEIGPVERAPTTEMVKRYARAVGMPPELRFFFDPEAAKAQGFARPIVPGPLNTTYLSQLVKEYFTGWKLRTLSTTFRTPAAHGQTLSYWGTVTQKDWNGGLATVHCDLVIENEHGDRVITGTAVLSRAESEPEGEW